MGILSIMNAGRKALAAGKMLLSKVDFKALLGILQSIIDLETSIQEPGRGDQKLERLLDWVSKEFPQTKSWIDEVMDFVSAAVSLFNAVGWFRK